MSKEQKMIKDEVANLIKGVVAENADEMDKSGDIPGDAIQKGWELGASVTGVPEEFGGFGMADSPITTTIILEELAFGDMAYAIAVTAPSLMISPILSMGTDAQQKKYLPLFCKEAYAPCTLALTEPHFLADPANLKTKADRKNGAYVLNGEKCFVPLADAASHIMVAASAGGENSLFIVGRDNPGLTVKEKERNLGLYSLDTYELTLENCEIPAEDRLGGESGCDYDLFIQKCRIGMSAIATGAGLFRVCQILCKRAGSVRRTHRQPAVGVVHDSGNGLRS
jgi:alkylation response protein AidB-like acyl-CoA dehydrogenase